ncbi:hypothetical protein [Halarchaeum sp. P4]|uniref:hypothetical protein n=1 Tax=Halarchaeum sp. P4 TaxID=3421639 RepID=UPI003EBCC5C7
MKTKPDLPRVANPPDGLLDSGHLWLVEYVDGAPLRFQLQNSGLLRFGDDRRVYDDPDAMPDEYAHAVRHVREHLDRDALRRAVPDVEDVVFFGVATHYHGITYDWANTPSVLGVDVWSEREGTFRPPDAVEQIYEALGLHPINAVEREVNTRDFDPEEYTIPESAWYDGPAAGVVVRDKQGRRALLPNPDVDSGGDERSLDVSADELAARLATRRRFERVETRLADAGHPVTVDALYERVREDVLRAEHARLTDARVDMQAFHGELAARTRAYLDDETTL